VSHALRVTRYDTRQAVISQRQRRAGPHIVVANPRAVQEDTTRSPASILARKVSGQVPGEFIAREVQIAPAALLDGIGDGAGQGGGGVENQYPGISMLILWSASA
jgi:hypothetical protein